MSKTTTSIRAELRQLGVRAWTRDELYRRLLTEKNRVAWRLSETISAHKFAARLVDASILQKVQIEFPTRNIVRYLFGRASPYEVAQSFGRDGYFSHLTAMHLHGLTDQIPKTIYLNIEQQMRPGGGEIDQDALDRTFRRPCRVSHNIAIYSDFKITLLNGGNTDKLGVEQVVFSQVDAPVRVTSIERTLIDAAVRPIYSGGVFEVARAFRAAKARASVEGIAAMLRTINYTYPYHQVIGFYLEREGYRPADVDIMRNFSMPCDFYLDYGMRQTEYCKPWRLHIPKGF